PLPMRHPRGVLAGDAFLRRFPRSKLLNEHARPFALPLQRPLGSRQPLRCDAHVVGSDLRERCEAHLTVHLPQPVSPEAPTDRPPVAPPPPCPGWLLGWRRLPCAGRRGGSRCGPRATGYRRPARSNGCRTPGPAEEAVLSQAPQRAPVRPRRQPTPDPPLRSWQPPARTAPTIAPPNC